MWRKTPLTNRSLWSSPATGSRQFWAGNARESDRGRDGNDGAGITHEKNTTYNSKTKKPQRIRRWHVNVLPGKDVESMTSLKELCTESKKALPVSFNVSSASADGGRDARGRRAFGLHTTKRSGV